MAKRPPISSKLNICRSLKWTKHFEPRTRETSSLQPSLRVVLPYPDLSTVIYLCKDSYNDLPDHETIPNSFKRLWSVSTSSDKGGYFGAIYVDESAKQLVLVHRGTKSLAAIKADIDIWRNKISLQMLSAMTCTHQLKCEMEKSFPKWKLIIAGHSLGSYLTDVSIFSHMYLEPSECGSSFHKKNDIENLRSITILPYGIGIDGPGSFDIISKLRDMTDVRYKSGEKMRVDDLPVDHYIGVPNLVNSQYQQVGGFFQIPMELKNKKKIPILGAALKFLDDCSGKVSTHYLDSFISAFTGNEPPPLKAIEDFPKNQRERATVNIHSKSDSRTPQVVDGNYAVDRYQVTDISSVTTELRFFCSYVQKLLDSFDKVKLYAKQLTFLLENVTAEDREFINKVLTSLRLDERNAVLVCPAEGMNKQKMIPWINEFFTSYPHFINKETVICSMCTYLFTCQTPLQFKRDPFDMDFGSKLPYVIEAGNTSIAANEVVATLDHLKKKYLLLKASQIELLERIFRFDDDILNYAVVVVQVDNEHDTANFIRHFSSSKIIIIKYAKDAPVVRCKVDDLTDKCKKDLLRTEIHLQGKTVKLHDFVTSVRSDALFESLLSGGLDDIPKCIDIDPSNAYVDIERRLKELKDKSEQYVQSLEVQEAIKRSKVLIIADLPGSGKTTMATRLSLQLNDWVIMVKLNEKSAVLGKWHAERKNVGNSSPEDMLIELAGIDPLLKPLLQGAIEDWKSTVKICVICDAFDEVKADYAELVIEFLRRLNDERKISNIIVTTRPHLKHKLELSLQAKSCPLSRFSLDELTELHRKGELTKSLHTKSGLQSRFTGDELTQIYLKGELESHVPTESWSLIRTLHDELIALFVKRQFQKPIHLFPYSYNELVELHRNGKIKKSLQTEWCPSSAFTTVYEKLLDSHLNGKSKKSLKPQSSESLLLENFLHKKVFEYLRDRMVKYFENESSPFTSSESIEDFEQIAKESLNAKLSILIDLSYEELLKLHIEDKQENASRPNSYALATFSHEEGIEFMTKLIANPNYPRKRVKTLFEKFVQWMNVDVRQTPMMLQLIASKIQELTENSTHTLSVHSLYGDHVNQVFRQYVEVKAGAQNHSDIAKEMQESLFSTNLKFYYYFAIKEILHMSDEEIDEYGLRQPCNDTEKNWIFRHGLLVDSNDSFRFKHKTFAEYFMAKWLMSDCSKPQSHKLFVNVISEKRVAGNNVLVFLDGEAGKYSSSTDKIQRREKQFFEQMEDYYCTHNRRGMLSSERKVLSRYIFDGIKKYCGESTLQKVLLREPDMLFEKDTMDHFNFVMAVYHDAGLTSDPSAEPNPSGMYEILKRSVQKVENYNSKNEKYLFALLKLAERYLDYDGIMRLIRGLNRKWLNGSLLQHATHIKVFNWQIRFLRSLNRESELKDLVLDAKHKGNLSLVLCCPDIVHSSLKEMNSPVLNDLPKVFETIIQCNSSIWKHLMLNRHPIVNIDTIRYVCLVMFADQYGDAAANEFKLQLLSDDCKMLQFTLNAAATFWEYYYISVAAVLLEMAILSGLSDEDVETVLDAIFHYTREGDGFIDHLFVFAALGSAVAMKKLLNGVVRKSDSGLIRTYTVDVYARDKNGRTALQIAERCVGDKHKLVVDVIKQHIRDRGPHDRNYSPWAPA